MKYLNLIVFLLPFSAFSQVQEVSPELKLCPENVNLLSRVQSPIKKYATTISGDINVLGLLQPTNDAALWSLQYAVAITFPVTNNDGRPDIACYLLENASLTSNTKVKSLSYDAKKGRLIGLEAEIATYDSSTDTIGSKMKSIRLRINKEKASVSVEK